MKSKQKPAEKRGAGLSVRMEGEVARLIRQHGRSSMKAEVCGVLIGREEPGATFVDACIEGVNAAQGGAHVTFTQETWEHIYQVKDKKYPDERIVGWYHSHPGFGVFLSEHDLFIQENFFSSPQQIAWVYDPHTDEEGCFGWRDGKVAKLNDVSFAYAAPIGAVRELEEEESTDDGAHQWNKEPPGEEGINWGDVTFTAASYLAVFVVGFFFAYMLITRTVSAQAEEVLREKVGQVIEQVQHDEQQRCEVLLRSRSSGGEQKTVPAQPAGTKDTPPAPNRAEPSQKPAASGAAKPGNEDSHVPRR